MARGAATLFCILASCWSVHSEEASGSVAEVRDMIRAATAAAIEYHCDGYRMSKSMKEIYDLQDKLGSDGPNWKAWLSLMDDAEQQYGLHLNEPAGCKRALTDWGPRSSEPLVVKSK
jgi:hypothetical protein